jgi:hypothetical protein
MLLNLFVKDKMLKYNITSGESNPRRANILSLNVFLQMHFLQDIQKVFEFKENDLLFLNSLSQTQ